MAGCLGPEGDQVRYLVAPEMIVKGDQAGRSSGDQLVDAGNVDMPRKAARLPQAKVPHPLAELQSMSEEATSARWQVVVAGVHQIRVVTRHVSGVLPSSTGRGEDVRRRPPGP